MRTLDERRALRKKAIRHAQKLEKDLGTKSGTMYERHVNKIKKNPGRYSKGSLSHYIATKPKIKSGGKNYKHSSTISSRPDAKDIRRKNDMDDQVNEI